MKNNWDKKEENVNSLKSMDEYWVKAILREKNCIASDAQVLLNNGKFQEAALLKNADKIYHIKREESLAGVNMRLTAGARIQELEEKLAKQVQCTEDVADVAYREIQGLRKIIEGLNNQLKTTKYLSDWYGAAISQMRKELDAKKIDETLVASMPKSDFNPFSTTYIKSVKLTGVDPIFKWVEVKKKE